MSELLALVYLLAAAGSALAFFTNLRQFQRATTDRFDEPPLAVSVLIPARNEEQGIAATLESIRANTDVEFEVLVLDDQSTDATARIVADLAARDARLRLLAGRPLPPDWCGKQHACAQLAEAARYDELLFLDADVRLSPDALRRCLLEKRRTQVDLLSGFPRQQVGTLGESLLIPLLYIVLLTYLPFRRMRATTSEMASAGCGQLFLCSAAAYRQSGGHAMIRHSLHDGITLPRAFRRAGLKTDLFDAADIARCRMYCGLRATWRGLLKNAHEGVANVRLIIPATLLMFAGYLGPPLLAVQQAFYSPSAAATVMAITGALFSYLPRIATALRYDRRLAGVVLFPLGVGMFLALQWIALVRSLRGTHTQWRGRAYRPTAAQAT